MNLDKNLVKPFWYIDIETLVTILKVIKDLDEDLKRKIVSIIALRNKKQEEIITLRLKMIEIEISYIKENLPGKITNMLPDLS